MQRDHDADQAYWRSQAEYMLERLRDFPGRRRELPVRRARAPSPARRALASARVRASTPTSSSWRWRSTTRAFFFEPTGLSAKPNAIAINTQTMQPGEEQIVAEALHAAIAARLPRQAVPQAREMIQLHGHPPCHLRHPERSEEQAKSRDLGRDATREIPPLRSQARFGRDDKREQQGHFGRNDGGARTSRSIRAVTERDGGMTQTTAKTWKLADQFGTSVVRRRLRRVLGGDHGGGERDPAQPDDGARPDALHRTRWTSTRSGTTAWTGCG